MTSDPTPASRVPRRGDPRMRTVEIAAVRHEDVADSETLGSGPVRPRLAPWKVALLVAAGGALGAILRYTLTVLAPTVTTPTLVEVPWATLWVNVLGCLALGALNGSLEVRPGRPWMTPLLGTGLCGGFTTMSTVVLEGSAMIGANFPILALFYAAETVVLCLGAVALGLLIGRHLAARSLRRTAEGADEGSEAR
ncbi:fluoride efflux transporter FluC [Brachybacterium aquaticum]|uniref:Fluoride-specific ion channel FluC n=1 Tax=Brachybacterium aquaticum TaxID=1432564 RepID=A0A841AAY3_9MICO|nr:CrcB family protein [Brachybacterium aquaticum]MBB5830462.1 CrcB protein [Brachybacterium aquaticum]